MSGSSTFSDALTVPRPHSPSPSMQMPHEYMIRPTEDGKHILVLLSVWRPPSILPSSVMENV